MTSCHDSITAPVSNIYYKLLTYIIAAHLYICRLLYAPKCPWKRRHLAGGLCFYLSALVRPAHAHPRNAPFPLQPSRHGVPDSHERMTSKSRKPSFAFYGRRDTLGDTTYSRSWSVGGRGAGFPSRPLSCFDLCPDFSESFDGQWMKNLLATMI